MSSSIEQAAAAGAGDPAEPPADSASDAGATSGARKKPGTGAKPSGGTAAAQGTAGAGQSAANGADAGTDAANGGPSDERADVTVTDEDAAAEGRPGDERGTDERGADDLGTGERGADERGAGERGADDLGTGERGADERGAEQHGAGDSGASESGASASRASDNGAGGNGVGGNGTGGADADGWAGGRDDSGFLDDEPDTSWFLPAGRAALAPEAVTVDDGQLDREPASRRAGAATRVAGSPPWAGESAAGGAQAPPPWESGPWHSSSEHPDAAGDEPAPGERQGAVPDGEPVGVAGAAGQPGGSGSAANPLAAGALITGVLGILVLPGVILGVLGLRRASVTGTGRIASWLGIALSLLWAAGIVLVAVPSSSAPPDPGCKSYQAHGRAAAAKVMAAIKAAKPASVLGGELHHAAVVINKAAARSWTLNVRNALSSLTDDLQAADDQVSGGGQVPSQLAGELSADASAADSVCGS